MFSCLPSLIITSFALSGGIRLWPHRAQAPSMTIHSSSRYPIKVWGKLLKTVHFSSKPILLTQYIEIEVGSKVRYSSVFILWLCVCVWLSAIATADIVWARDLKFGHSALLVTRQKRFFFFLIFFPELCPLFGFPTAHSANNVLTQKRLFFVFLRSLST